MNLAGFTENLKPSERMPMLFVGHGSPMNAIEDNPFSRSWSVLGKSIQRPQAILCVSAHWLTTGTQVTAMEQPRTIHDFGGFPRELFEQQYPAQGSPELASDLIALQTRQPIARDFDWGLDHGTWSVLKPMFPLADIPVVQLSIDYSKPPEYHFELTRQLAKIREKGVLVIGSGNLVHNLGRLQFDNKIPDWSFEFDSKMAAWLKAGDDLSIVNFLNLGKLAQLAHPTYDHFLPLLYVLGMKSKTDVPEFFNEGFQLGSISMRSVIWK